MVSPAISVLGVGLNGVTQSRPVIVQLNDDDFPKAFLGDMAAMPKPSLAGVQAGALPLSTTVSLRGTPQTPVTLYQPVTRVLHLAVVQLNCESPGMPRLCPRRVLSAGVVIRQVPLGGGEPAAAAPWMSNAKGQTDWVPRNLSQADDDPDPARRPLLHTGQPALDRLLAAQTLASAMTESTTPAFVAAPEVCDAAQRTLVYALIPTASSEASTQHPPGVSQLSSSAILPMLPTLLKSGCHSFPQQDQVVDYQWMSDEFAKSKNAADFITFSTTLRMLYGVFNIFDGSAGTQAVLNVLNRLNVTIQDGSYLVQQPMGQFYQEAAAALIDYDPHGEVQPPPRLRMPHSWDFLSDTDQTDLLNAMAPLLQTRGNAMAAPQGRFQDAKRLYRARLFFRIKNENPSCPPHLVWSCYSDPFRIAAWYESAGRATAPVPLPDPFDRNVLKNAKPTSSFAVPPSLMNAMNGASLTGLSNGQAPAGGGGAGLGWICSFSIPLISICAFFVLNIFLGLLNIVFFWMAFIKICIPFPATKE